MPTFNPLTPEEERVILRKGTERPFTGKYYKNKTNGIYLCRQCNAPLYFSQDKFDSGCGWPSFDDDIPNAVKRVLDADGRRVEIVCNTCEGHLGHVFERERFTAKNTRHCVNSISMQFVPKEQSNIDRAVFAGGCFWGKEYLFQHTAGVIATRVGYTGGDIATPTHREVSSGLTGHTESVEIIFDKTKIDFETLAKIFFEAHNPTNKKLQGENNKGKYRSAIFYVDEEQKQVAEKLIKHLTDKDLEIVTELSELKDFYAAPNQHQQYYTKLDKQPENLYYEKRF